MRGAFSLRSPKAAEFTADELSSAFAREVLCAALTAPRLRIRKSIAAKSRIMATQPIRTRLGSLHHRVWAQLLQEARSPTDGGFRVDHWRTAETLPSRGDKCLARQSRVTSARDLTCCRHAPPLESRVNFST